MIGQRIAPCVLALLVAMAGVNGLPQSGPAPHPPSHHGLNVEGGPLPVPQGATSRPLPPETPCRITVSLAPRSAGELASFDRAVADPASSLFGHYLSEAEFEARFAPDPSNVSTLVQYFSSFGATSFTVTPDRLGVAFVLPSSGAERAFGTPLVSFQTPDGRQYQTTAAPPQLPARLAQSITGVGGLVGALSVGPVIRSVHPPLGSPSAGSDLFLNGTGIAQGVQWFVGSDFVAAYHENALLPGTRGSVPNATYASGVAIATLLMSGYNDSTGRDLPPWEAAPIDRYFNDTFPASWPRPQLEGVPVSIGNRTPPAPGSPGTLNDTALNVEENALDLEMAGSMAPGSRLVNFYFAASLLQGASSSPTFGQIADDFALTLASALAHNYSPRQLVAISGSFGLPDLNDSLWNTELAHAAAVGVTVLSASGDQGNAPDSKSGRFQGPWPTWPATAAFDSSGTIAVGGVSLAVSGTATASYDGSGAPSVAYDPTVTGVMGQTAWYDSSRPGHLSGSEGGGSVVVAEPAWQFRSAAQPSIASAQGVQGISRLGRAEPDVAFPAAATIAYTKLGPSGATVYAVLEGTSIAAPVFAGLLAECAAVSHHPFGYLLPELYRIASYFAAHPENPASPFLDVTRGATYVFAAAPGWDAVTGWGGLDAQKFLAADSNGTIRGYVYQGPTPGLPHRPATPIPFNLLLALPIGVAIAAAIVLWIALERRTSAGVPPIRPPPFVPAAGAPVASWFYCPYCGAPRPSEPVRCPVCGRL